MSPTVAVIVPVFNVGLYLTECLDSFLSQTYENFVIYAINDGSTDTSGMILDCYKKKDSRIHVIHKKNEGVSSARNAGLDTVLREEQAEFICFIDGDDKVSETFLYDMVEAMVSSEVQMGFCLYQEFGKSGFIEFSNASENNYPKSTLLQNQNDVEFH